LTNVIAIAAGGNHSLALRADGKVVGWGNNSRGQTNVPPTATNIVEITAGNEFSVGLREDGTLIAWGDFVGTNLPPALPALDTVVAGGYYTAALTGVGTVRIIQQPRSVTAVAGDSPVFRCSLAGRPRLAPQWRFNGAPLAGRTNQFLCLPDATPADAGIYSMVATNGNNGVQSSDAILTVLPLAITLQPTNLDLYGGDTATFEVRARNVAPFSYQWLRNDVSLPGETNSVLTLTNVSLAQTGSYSAIVSNPYGFKLSDSATLGVVPLSILGQPTNRTIYSGETALFSVTPWKNGPFSYQWRFNGVDVPDATNQVLTVSNAATNQAGDYSVRVSNPYGSILSASAALTVAASSPVILVQPSKQNAWHLGSALLQSSATGSKPLTYQWRFNGQPIAGATNSTLTLTGLTAQRSGNYSVLFSNALGTISSTNAFVTVVPVAYWGTSQTSIRTPPFLPNPVALASDGLYALALRDDSSVLAWGNSECPPLLPGSLSNITALAAGTVHALAVRSNGTVTAWGCNTYGETTVPGRSEQCGCRRGGFRGEPGPESRRNPQSLGHLQPRRCSRRLEWRCGGSRRGQLQRRAQGRWYTDGMGPGFRAARRFAPNDKHCRHRRGRLPLVGFEER
jgi:hypothetical protein